MSAVAEANIGYLGPARPIFSNLRVPLFGHCLQLGRRLPEDVEL